jgi:hypothetical protein
MRGTAFIYSSHNRSEYIHRHFIVERALRGRENRRILFLPMSEPPQNGSERERQEFSWGTFRWYFDFFARYGLEYFPFYWSSHLSKRDVDLLWYWLYTSEVVILGGGHSATGMARYKELGARFDGEWGKFGRILHERKARGLLTVGFSAGADQLCESLARRVYTQDMNGAGFGLVRNTLVTLHHEPVRMNELYAAAHRFQSYRVFGLPNDSGINHDWGHLPSGNVWQVYEFVTDNSWDLPNDAHHIKTRQGAGIEHVYPDGRHWTFRGGDLLVRVESQDGQFQQAWMRSGGSWLHYWTQMPAWHHSVEEILSKY